MITPQLIAFTGLVTVLTMTPAATTMLVIGSVVSYGRRAGFMVILGGSIGIYLHAMLSALGLSVILVQSAAAFQAVRLIGAGYIVFLGCRSIWRALRSKPRAPSELIDPPCAAETNTQRQSFVDGLVTVILSPEAAMFYLATLPQFIHHGESALLQSLFLASIHVLVRFVWYPVLIVFVGKVTAILRRPRVQQALELFSGVALVLFGARAVTARR
jgi:threonine/homoserine/homoserine lactone efflux protein